MQDSDKAIFTFWSYSLNDHGKTVLCKGLSFAIPPNSAEYSEFLLPYEMLFRDITGLKVDNFNPNKGCFFRVVFSETGWVNSPHPSPPPCLWYFKSNLSNINITLQSC